MTQTRKALVMTISTARALQAHFNGEMQFKSMETTISAAKMTGDPGHIRRKPNFRFKFAMMVGIGRERECEDPA